MALLLAMVNVWPLFDVGFDPTAPAHVELPDGSSPVHHSAHDHGLCGVMGSVHVLPVEQPRVLLGTCDSRTIVPVVPSGLPSGLTFTVHRSRAPPSA